VDALHGQLRKLEQLLVSVAGQAAVEQGLGGQLAASAWCSAS
jgi:hypothetical protein